MFIRRILEHPTNVSQWHASRKGILLEQLFHLYTHQSVLFKSKAGQSRGGEVHQSKLRLHLGFAGKMETYKVAGWHSLILRGSSRRSRHRGLKTTPTGWIDETLNGDLNWDLCKDRLSMDWQAETSTTAVWPSSAACGRSFENEAWSGSGSRTLLRRSIKPPKILTLDRQTADEKTSAN